MVCKGGSNSSNNSIIAESALPTSRFWDIVWYSQYSYVFPTSLDPRLLTRHVTLPPASTQ